MISGATITAGASFSFFFCVLEFVGQNLDEGEFLDVKTYTLDELYDMVMDNKIYDAKTAIAILKAKAILG